jgi:glycosyltransferase involved in cell wall biosynthesis
MAVLAVVTSSPSAVEGGHLVIARALVQAAREAGHDAELVVTPDCGFGRVSATYLAARTTDVSTRSGRHIDQVISLRYPSYAVPHPAHVCWLNHTMREYYDLWPRFSATLSRRNRLKERMRRQIVHGVDRWLLGRLGSRLVAQSETIAGRLNRDFGIRAGVLLPPAPPRPYRCDGYGDYVFLASRLTPLKRIDLLVRALAEPAARHVNVVVAGDGESRSALESLARALGVADRIRLLGRIDDRAMLDHLAGCRAVCFTPFAEDYGLVVVEAFASRKAVVTCRDSGGPTELVRHEETGVVCDPAPADIALALARLTDDEHLAERLGVKAAAQAAAMTWDGAVRRLVIV